MDIEVIRQRALSAIAPLKPADAMISVPHRFDIGAKRTDAGRSLPPYYLVYFLLVELLGFKELGQWEKTAWSVPVDYNGQAFLIDHRKFGVGVFAANLPADEPVAAEIVRRIHSGVKAARPYFDEMASQATKGTKLNVVNRSRELYGRLDFFLDLYASRAKEAADKAGKSIRTDLGHGRSTLSFPATDLRREAKWFALTVIESFFSYTEHVFIHIAILRGRCPTGADVAKLAEAEWHIKFKAALDFDEPGAKAFYDELGLLRRNLRNAVAHGAFGKDGEAFHFHSSAGAVPVLMPHNRDRGSFKFGQGVNLKADEAIDAIQRFLIYLWSGPRAPAKIYIQDYQLPLILTHVSDGQYARAMSSVEDMSDYAGWLGGLLDRSANMDF